MVRDICNIIISPDKCVKAANENKQSSERHHYMQASKDQLEATRVELHQQAPDFFDPIPLLSTGYTNLIQQAAKQYHENLENYWDVKLLKTRLRMAFKASLRLCCYQQNIKLPKKYDSLIVKSIELIEQKAEFDLPAIIKGYNDQLHEDFIQRLKIVYEGFKGAEFMGTNQIAKLLIKCQQVLEANNQFLLNWKEENPKAQRAPFPSFIKMFP